MHGKPAYLTAINNEQSLADFIPYSSHVNDSTLITLDGDLLSIFRLEGITFETDDEHDLTRVHQRLNTLYRGLSEEGVSLWSTVLRRKMPHAIHGEFSNPFCRRVDEKYQEAFNGDVLINELYLSVIQRKNSGVFNSPSRVHAIAKQQLHERIEAFEDIKSRMIANLAPFNTHLLGCHNGCSDSLSFLNFLLSGQWSRVKIPTGLIRHAIGHARIAVGTDTIELRGNGKVRYAQGVELKAYGDTTENGFLDGLLYANYEFVLTQSFSLYTKKEAHKYLKARKRQMSNSGDEAITQLDAMASAIVELLDGQFAMGEFHFSLFVFGNTVAQVRLQCSEAQKQLADADLLSVSMSIATDAAFFAQLPGNWQYRPRVVGLTSRNFASFSPFHNFFIGKRDGNPWGAAVTRFNTPSGQPFYHNFHSSKMGVDDFGEKRIGNTLMIGMSGTGKTVLLSFLFCQLQKFSIGSPFSAVYFDIDRGAEAMIRAIGGHYFQIKNGEPTGFNPFQMEATKGNLSFLKMLVRTLVCRASNPLTIQDEFRINNAVDTVMGMDRAVRRLSLVQQNISEGTDKLAQEAGLKIRLNKWCVGGEFGWVFDNETDTLDFSINNNIGIDGSEFLRNFDVKTPIGLYLLHRLNDIIDGRRFTYFMDEAWMWVDDEAFTDFIGKNQVTIRKRNGFGVFATQMPSALLNSKQGAALIAQSPTQIFLPNPKAERDEYVNGLKLTDAEFAIVRSFSEESRLCLIKNGNRSVICSLNMPNMVDELNVLACSTDQLPFLEGAIEEMGKDPSLWIPVYLEKIAADVMKKRHIISPSHSPR